MTLKGVSYNSESHEDEGSSAWNMSLLELEEAYKNAGIAVNESIKIEDIFDDASEAAVHFRISGVQNTTGYDISSESFKNTEYNLKGKHYIDIQSL